MNFQAKIKTQKEQEILLAGLEKIESQLYLNSKAKARLLIPPLLKAEAEKQGVNLNQPAQTKSFSDEIRKKLLSLATVNLTLAFRPSAALVKKITSWFKKNLSSQAILAIQTDPGILGGAIISFNGHYHDFSLKKQLEKHFKTQKEDEII